MNETMKTLCLFQYRTWLERVKAQTKQYWSQVNLPKSERKGLTGPQIQERRFRKYVDGRIPI